jgi:hypothetical protein
MNTRATLEDFARWCKSVSFLADAQRINLSFEGVKKYVNKAAKADIESLITLVFSKRETPEQEVLDEFISCIKESDKNFIAKSTDNEITVLAGAALALASQLSTEIGSYTASMIENVSFDGHRQHKLDFDIVGIANGAYQDRSIAIRGRQPFEYKKIKALSSKETILKQYTEKPELETLKLVIESLLLELKTFNVSTDERIKEIVDRANSYIQMQDEELQILWWLFGGKSWELQSSFADIQSDIRTLVMAKELADFTNFSLGTVNAQSILAKTGIPNTPCKVATVVDGIPIPTLQKFVSGKFERSPLLYPIHTAIARKLETPGDSTWINGWATITELKSDVQLSFVRLSEIFYRERVALKGVGDE